MFDGCCEPRNPGGKIGWGYIVKYGREKIYSDHGFEKASPSNTNNIAEYIAVINCLYYIYKNQNNFSSVTIFGDSKLVIMQLLGKWEIKNGAYTSYAIEAKEILENIGVEIKFRWIPREYNEEADKLSKKHITEFGNWNARPSSKKGVIDIPELDDYLETKRT